MTCLATLNDLFTGAVFVNRNHTIVERIITLKGEKSTY